MDFPNDVKLYLEVQNIGTFLVSAFSVIFPDGPRRFAYSLEPGQISEFAEHAAAAEMKKTEVMALRGELGLWTVSIADFQANKDHSKSATGLPIQLILSAISETTADVKVSFPAESDYFLDESEVEFSSIHGPRVLGYVRSRIEILNTSKEFLREMHYRFEGAVGKEWKELRKGTILTMLPSGVKSLTPIVVPAQILEGSTKLRFQLIRLVVTRVFHNPDRSRNNKPAATDRRNREFFELHFGVLSLVQATGAPRNMVDELPIPLSRERAAYTEEALKDRVQGVVRLQALVDADGVVKRIKIIKHLPNGLDEQAMLAAYRTKFKPAIKGGQPVPFWQVIEVTFTL